jgi:hypothetical protein
LLRVLAVAQRLGKRAGDGAGLRRCLAELRREPRRDRRVIGGGAGKARAASDLRKLSVVAPPFAAISASTRE